MFLVVGLNHANASLPGEDPKTGQAMTEAPWRMTYGKNTKLAVPKLVQIGFHDCYDSLMIVMIVMMHVFMVCLMVRSFKKTDSRWNSLFFG